MKRSNDVSSNEPWTVDASSASGHAADRRVADHRAADRRAFPGGKRKALIMSFDDGVAADRRLVRLFDDYKIKGTFNLNSGRLGQANPWLEGKSEPSYIAEEEVRNLYAAHEVAAHTVTHPRMEALSPEEAAKEVREDRAALERLTGRPVRGFAWPFGTYAPFLFPILWNEGIICARNIEDSHGFGLPSNLLAWAPTIHYSAALPYARDFLSLDASEPALLYVWGHSYEMDDPKGPAGWEYFESVCRLLGGRSDLWYAGAQEVAEWMLA